MAMDFPANPTVNQVYQSGGITYRWSGQLWVPQGGSLPALEKANNLSDLVDKEAAKANLGFYGKHHASYDISGVSSFNINFPSGVERMKITGQVFTPDVTAYFLTGRLSYNNGVSYLNGSNYVEHFFYNNAGAMAVAGGTAQTYWDLGSDQVTANIPIMPDVVLFRGRADKRASIRVLTSTHGGSGVNKMMNMVGYSEVGVATHFRLMFHTGTTLFGAGSVINVEFA